MDKDCESLVRRMLKFKPDQRPTMVALLSDPWVAGKTVMDARVHA